MANSLTDSTVLYRIMPLSRFHEMLETGMNVLVHPSVWVDPYEKALADSCFVITDNNDVRRYKFNENHWYAQCWTLKVESDALWNIFAPCRSIQCKKDNKEGHIGKEVLPYVKIKTTVGLLKQSLKTTRQEEETECMSFYVLDNVNYVKDCKEDFERSILERIECYKFSVPEEQQVCLGLLLTKRIAFEYESEVRLLRYCEPLDSRDSEMEASHRLYKYPINVRELILEVEFDPWTKKICKGEKKRIAKKIGTGKVKKSKLYEQPKAPLYNIKKNNNWGSFDKLFKSLNNK